jgi:hypothetical protein
LGKGRGRGKEKTNPRDTNRGVEFKRVFEPYDYK